MPELQGIKGEAVVVYRDPLITQEMGYPRLSRRVNKMKIKIDSCTSLMEEIPNVKKILINSLVSSHYKSSSFYLHSIEVQQSKRNFNTAALNSLLISRYMACDPPSIFSIIAPGILQAIISEEHMGTTLSPVPVSTNVGA